MSLGGPKDVLGIWLSCLLLLGGPVAARSDASLDLLRRPVNSVLVPPAGEGLTLLRSAEPLGKGRFSVRAVNRSQSVMVPELGAGHVFTGDYGFAYGLGPRLDVSLVVPFLLDAAGGLNKYGTGDPVVGVKYARTGQIPADFYLSYQMLLGLPLGYKGEHGLDEYNGGIRPFSTSGMGLGLQVMMDVHFRRGVLYLNGGYYRSSNTEIQPELVYGIGVEAGRTNRWVSVNAEYLTRIAFADQSRGVASLKLGVRFNVYRGVQFEVNREYGFLDSPADQMTSFGLRLHGYLSGNRRLESRYVLYEPAPPPPRLYAPRAVVRIAMVDFAGYEDLDAGERLVAKLRSFLASHDSLEVVDLRRYADVPHRGFLSPVQAQRLARRLGVDVVLTGQIEDYEVRRFSGVNIPYVVRLPETRVDLRLRYRVLEFSADKTRMQQVIDQVEGHSRQPQSPRLMPTDPQDVTASPTAGQMMEAREKALNDLAGNLLAAMAARFAWVPPDFSP